MDSYRLKKIEYDGKTIPIVLQNINGPCPLLAICNILLMQGKIHIHLDYGMVTYDQLVALLSDALLSKKAPTSEDLLENYNRSVAEVISLFPLLQYGLDVNVRFQKITDFEFTRELTVFDLFDIRLVHGWIAPEPLLPVIGNLSYNEVVEKLIHLSEHRDETTEEVEKEKQLETFMNESSSQLSFEGLEKLSSNVQDGEYSVFFRNNHFSVLHNRNGIVYLLVTDQGYLYQKKIMWELLDSVDGDNQFVAPDFTMYDPNEISQEEVPKEELIDCNNLVINLTSQLNTSASSSLIPTTEQVHDIDKYMNENNGKCPVQ